MDLLIDLNPQQQQAVMAGLGPVLILAGPGSGKTRVLTRRIAYLISSLGVRPYNILAVTFTNKAAREMENRVVELIGENSPGLTLGTFHAICARILRREADHLPFDSNFVIFDEADQRDLVKRALTDLNLEEKRYRSASVHSAISNAKNELILPDDLTINNYRDEVVKRIYRRYQELLLVNNALDFDDLLLWTAYLLKENPIVCEKYARRYEHILVDEFQDTNLAQYLLLKLLASFHGNLFVVGDADQSIYRWRGADYRNVLRFEQDYPDNQVILLEQNYRSTQAILDVAMAVIDRNPQRTPKRLFTDRGQGQKITLYEAYDDRVEADYVVNTITSMVMHKQANPGDFAVMYRTNAQSRLLEEAFLHAGLQYKLVGAQRFYGRREIKDVIAYLRFVHNPKDEISLTRVINTPPRGIGNKTFLTLRTQAQKAGLASGEYLVNSSLNNGAEKLEVLGGRTKSALLSFSSMLIKWIAMKGELTPLVLMDRILGEVDYHSYIDDGTDEGHDRWENILELRRLAAEYQEQGLEAFLEKVALVSDQDTMEDTSKIPTLLTLHAAKGLEFPIVFITGLNDGSLPHSRSFDDPEAMLEERRLFYVGITRARDRLFFVYALNRSAYGYVEPVDHSRYLDDIPYGLIDEAQLPRAKKRPRKEVPYHPERWLAQDERGQTQSTSSAGMIRRQAPEQPTFSAGMRVQHPSWGEGMVLNSRLQNGDEIVDIFFEEIGLKRVAASLARLEIKV
jgi:DNA helicase-2/ATP-dependent DNA helicase PcrA